MKKILLSLLLSLFVTAGYAQQSPDGVWGLPFGTSMDQARKILKEKHGVSPVLEDDESLVYENCRFGEHDGSSIDLYFFDRKLYKGIVSVPPKSEPDILDEYKAMLNTLTAEYGKPVKSMEDFTPPFKKGDGHEIEAIQDGKGDVSAFWIFPAGQGIANAKASILLSITKRKDFMLSYTDRDLEKKANDAMLKSDQSDY